MRNIYKKITYEDRFARNMLVGHIITLDGLSTKHLIEDKQGRYLKKN